MKKAFWVIFHTLLTFATGGIWLIPLGIWYILTRTRRAA